MPKNVMQSIDKWKKSMQTAGDALKAGVSQVTESPGVRAAAAKDKYQRRVIEAVNDGTYEAGQLSYSVQDWKDAMTGKGIGNMMNGAAKLDARKQRAMQEQLQYANDVSAQVAGMPTGTLEESIAKANAAIRLMAAGRRGRR